MPYGKLDSFNAHDVLKINNQEFHFANLQKASKGGLGDISRLPYSLKVLLENLLRFENGITVSKQDINAMALWLKEGRSDHEVAFFPARVLMQDFTGVPAVVDLAAMRQGMIDLGGNPKKINPLSPVDLVIDHSITVDHSGTPEAFSQNVELEFQRNGERYAFLRWAQQSFTNFKVVPPGAGIIHQVNLEYLASVAFTEKIDDKNWVYPDTVFGTDSHTVMANALGILGWGVGGIEAEAAMLRQPTSMVIPEVVGVKLSGTTKEGTTATDVVLTITQKLRKLGVVGKFVEFFGPGLDQLTLADRATIANMAPEYGATCGFFPIDAEVINYLKFTGRKKDQTDLIEAYAKAQGLWRDNSSQDPIFTEVIEMDLSTVVPSLAGPRRPQDRITLDKTSEGFKKELVEFYKVSDVSKTALVSGTDYSIGHGNVMIASITSCTNTSNPSVIMAAGLLAKKAVELGLQTKPWVKTSLAPGSQVVTDYLQAAGLTPYLNTLGFNLVGYGCTVCIGNAGPLEENISATIKQNSLVCAAVLSGNRNFEGRISPDLKANYLASPPLVVAYAIAGSMNINLANDPIGVGKDGKKIFLKDIWPTNNEIKEAISKVITPEMFQKRYADVFKGSTQWQAIKAEPGLTFNWNNKSTYVQNPPYFKGIKNSLEKLKDIVDARPLAILGDSITTDHISPAGTIGEKTPAGQYLVANGVSKADFNQYGTRRGNHEVMWRGTFANIRLKNEMVPGIEGGVTKYMPEGTQMSIFDASTHYQSKGVPLVIFAGKEYGTGSSRDWAAKGTYLLGVRAVVVESYERIHRSNLVGMGVLPLEFPEGVNRQTLKLDGSEVISIKGIPEMKPRGELVCEIKRTDGKVDTLKLKSRIDTVDELEYFKNGGILQYVMRKLI